MPSIELWVTSWLLDVSIKAALLALAAWSGMAICRVRSTSVRHRVWLLVLVGMLLLPALVHLAPGVSLPGWLYPTLQLAAVAGEADGGTPSTTARQPAADRLAAPAPSEPRSALPLTELKPTPNARDAASQGIVKEAPTEAATVPLPAQQVRETPKLPASTFPSVARRTARRNGFALAVVSVYLAGVASLMVRLLIGTLQTSRLVRHARPIDSPSNATWLPTRTKVVESDEVQVPVTIGYWWPVVVLPADWKAWSDSFLAMALAHEAEHVRRRDTWVALFAAVNCVVYWFHPLAWIVRRRLTDLAERACDDEVIRAMGNRSEYAQNLLDMVGRLTLGSGRLRPIGVAMARKANVVKRIEAIIDNDRPLSRKIGATGALLLVCVMAPLVFLAAGLRSTAPTIAAEAETTAGQSEKAGDVDEPESSATSLKGRVVMAADGKPVADAEVWLLTWTSEGLKRNTATTNEQGEFEFKELTEGRHTLAAYYQNLSSRSTRYKGYEAKAGDESIVLELREAPSLAVKVVTRAEGKPIEDATVRLTWTDSKRDHLTDANGEVVIFGLTSEVWTIETRAKGFAEDVQAVNLNGTDTSSVTAELDPGVELFGVVRDEAGEGLPNVGISVFPSHLAGGQIEYLETDADGGYRFEYLPIAGLKLMLSKEGYADVRPDVAITAPPGGRQELNLTLPRRPDGGSVRGTIVDADGKPVERASVVNRGPSSRDLRETTTDDRGRYRLDDVYKGPHGHDLFIKAKGFAPQHLEFTPGSREHPAELNVTLLAGHRIRGRVVDEQGGALPGVRVYYARGNRFPGIDFGGKTTTDAEGRFELDSLPAESPFAFSKDGYSEMEDETLPLDGAEEIVVTMQSAGVIRGRVVDDRTGEPLSSFTVRVTFSPDDPSGGLSGARAFGGEKFATRDGTFRLGEFVRGMPLQVIVEADGHDPAVARRVVAVADGNAEPVEFRLAPFDESSLLTIAGRLIDEHAKPLAGAELRLIVASKRPFPRDRFPFNWQMIRSGRGRIADSALQFLAATTDSEGRFTFERVRPSGDIELVYWGEGVSQNRREHLERLSPEALSDLTITSKTPGVVRGAIDGEVYPEFSNIKLSGRLAFRDAEVSEGKDSYEVRNVSEGRYELQVYGPARRSDRAPGIFTSDVIKRIPVEVKSGETVTIDLGFKSEDALQPAKDGEKATAEEPSTPGRSAASEKPSDDEPMGKTKAPATREPSAEDEDSAIVIVGNVTNASGIGIRGAKLWLPLKHDDDKLHAKATTNEAGEFTLRVPVEWTEPGTFTPSWTIWCYAQDHQIASASAYKQLQRQSDSPIEIVLKPSADTGFEVKDVAGAPVAGRRVEPMHFFTGSYDIIPPQLREIIAEETDEHGRVLFPETGRDHLFSVQVTADGYGIQQLRLRDSAMEPAIRTITLRPTGRLEGRLVSDDKTAFTSARVHVYQEDFLGEHTSGSASADADEDGRFVVPAFAEGAIKLIITVDRSLTLRPRIPEDLEIYSGETTRVEVPLERTVRIRGRVQTKGDGAPVAGGLVSVQYGSFRQIDLVRTDADGRFETNVLAGDVRQQLIMRPTEYSDWIVENAGWQNPINVPAGVETFDLAPLELIETSERAGRLVDRSNRPIAGAKIRAITGNRVYAWGETDESGAFTLRLPKGFEIEMYDVSRSRETGPSVAAAIKESPLVLQVPD